MKKKAKRYDEGGKTMAVPEPEIEREPESSVRSKELLAEEGRIIGGAMAPRRKIEDYIRKDDGQAAADAARGATEEELAAKIRSDLQKKMADRRAAERRKAQMEKDRAAERQSILKGEEYAARKMGEGYMKAAEAGKKMPAKEEKRSGFGPKITFNTPEKLEKARKAYYGGFKSGGKVSSASSRADGIAQRGKTRGRIC